MEHLSKLVQEIEKKNSFNQEEGTMTLTGEASVLKSEMENNLENQENLPPKEEMAEEGMIINDLEEISFQIKHAFNEKKNIRSNNLASRKMKTGLDAYLKDLISKCGKGLLGSRNQAKSHIIGSKAKSKVSIRRKNCGSHFQKVQKGLLRRVGLGLSEKEELFLNHDANVLMKRHGIELSIFGKILGTGGNYYIMYGLLDSERSENAIEKIQKLCPEPRGYGLNRFVILAGSLKKVRDTQNSHTMLNWTVLPPVSGSMMKGAIYTKKLITGDLNRNVKHLIFKGTEAQFLKCQIIRILVDCHLVPKGLYELNEETQKVIRLKEGVELPKDEEARSLENYVRFHKGILKSGRMERFVPETIIEDERQEYIDKLIESDPQRNPLSPLEENEINYWKVRVFGDKIKINDLAGENPSDNRAILISHGHWKGCHNIYYPTTGEHVFFYCGYGVNFRQTVFPMSFCSMQNDGVERTEIPEPNGKVETVEAEQDAQEEGKGDEESGEGSESGGLDSEDVSGQAENE